METCRYAEIEVDKHEGCFAKCQKTPFIRQLFVSSGVWTIHFLTGLSVGAPTIFIYQMRKQANSTAAVSDDTASWLSSVFGYSALPWIFILSALAHFIGRKKAFVIVCIISIINYIVFYCSQNTTHLLISSIMNGIFHASNLTLSIIILTEYTLPEFRGLFLTIKSATIFWGLWVSNAIGAFFHWRYIALVGLVCSIYTLTVFFWPESPFWLAKKSLKDECKKSHHWLKGFNETSETELENMLKSNKTSDSIFSREYLVVLFSTIKSGRFYKPILLSLLVMIQYSFTGKIVCSVYAIEIIKRITENESATYIGMLLLDGITVMDMYIGCALSKIVKRRNLLLISSSVAITFLFILSLYLHLVKLNVLVENNFVSITLLAIFSLAVSCGPLIMSSCLFGELLPMEFKSFSIIIISTAFNIITGTLLKATPFIFKSLGLDGTFFFYGSSSLFFTIILYFKLPETKDKTAMEISEYFADGDVKRNAMNGHRLIS